MEQAFLDEMKALLEEEKAELEKQLEVVANPDTGDHVPGDFVPERANVDGEGYADGDSEEANEVEQYALNANLTGRLGERYNEVKAALARMKAGTYGTCVKTGEQISEERLRANPAASMTIEAAKSHV